MKRGGWRVAGKRGTKVLGDSRVGAGEQVTGWKREMGVDHI